MNYVDATDVNENFTAEEKFRISTFLPIVDALITNLQRRAEAYQKLAELFDCLTDMDASSELLDKRVNALVAAYPDDIDNSLVQELH